MNPFRSNNITGFTGDYNWDTLAGPIRVLDKVLAGAPLHVPALVLQVLVALGAGDTRKAVQAGRQAAFLAADEPYPVYLYGLALARSGARAAAQQRLRWAEELLASVPDEQAVSLCGDLTAGALRSVIRAQKV